MFMSIMTGRELSIVDQRENVLVSYKDHLAVISKPNFISKILSLFARRLYVPINVAIVPHNGYSVRYVPYSDLKMITLTEVKSSPLLKAELEVLYHNMFDPIKEYCFMIEKIICLKD